MAISLDPEVNMHVTSNIRNDKSNILVKPFVNLFGERFLDKSLFTTANYDAWKPRRQLYDPAFNKTHLKTLIGTMDKITMRMVDKLRPMADGKSVLSLKKYIRPLITDIISNVGFSTDIPSIWSAASLGLKMPPSYDNVFNYIVNVVNAGVHFSICSANTFITQVWHYNQVKEYRKCIQALRKIGRKTVLERMELMKMKEFPQDILTSLFSDTSDKFSVEELVDDFINFFMAAQDTTANAALFSLILTAQHPNVLEAAKQEIKEVLGGKSDITETELNKLNYIEQIVKESLRLHPPAFGIAKELSSPHLLNYLNVPAKTDVFLMTANMCRQTEHFNDPHVFNPDRFHLDNKKPNSYVYFPFGLGHRSCIGREMAMMELKIILARMFQKFTIHFADDYKLEIIQRVSLHPRGEVPCTLSIN